MAKKDETLATLKSIDFWLGAIASNLSKLTQMEAKKRGIKLVWHDPNIAPWPAVKHGQPVDLSVLRVGLPPHMRAKKRA